MLLPNLAESLKNASELKGPADLSEVEQQYDEWYREANESLFGESQRQHGDAFLQSLTRTCFETCRDLRGGEVRESEGFGGLYAASHRYRGPSGENCISIS